MVCVHKTRLVLDGVCAQVCACGEMLDGVCTQDKAGKTRLMLDGVCAQDKAGTRWRVCTRQGWC